MRLMSADVSNLPPGSRVVVRWRLAQPDPASGATLTDSVGTLTDRDGEAVTVVTSRGPVRIERALVVLCSQRPFC